MLQCFATQILKIKKINGQSQKEKAQYLESVFIIEIHLIIILNIYCSFLKNIKKKGNILELVLEMDMNQQQK